MNIILKTKGEVLERKDAGVVMGIIVSIYILPLNLPLYDKQELPLSVLLIVPFTVIGSTIILRKNDNNMIKSLKPNIILVLVCIALAILLQMFVEGIGLVN